MAYALIYAGKPQKAFNFVKKAMRLDPHYPAYYLFVLGLAKFVLEEYETAVTFFEKALKLNPEDYVPLIPLAAAMAQLGHGQKATAALDKLQNFLPGIVTISLVRDLPLSSYKNPADRNRLLAGLRMAGMLETPYDALRKTKKP